MPGIRTSRLHANPAVPALGLVALGGTAGSGARRHGRHAAAVRDHPLFIEPACPGLWRAPRGRLQARSDSMKSSRIDSPVLRVALVFMCAIRTVVSPTFDPWRGEPGWLVTRAQPRPGRDAAHGAFRSIGPQSVRDEGAWPGVEGPASSPADSAFPMATRSPALRMASASMITGSLGLRFR